MLCRVLIRQNSKFLANNILCELPEPLRVLLVTERLGLTDSTFEEIGRRFIWDHTL